MRLLEGEMPRDQLKPGDGTCTDMGGKGAAVTSVEPLIASTALRSCRRCTQASNLLIRGASELISSLLSQLATFADGRRSSPHRTWPEFATAVSAPDGDESVFWDIGSSFVLNKRRGSDTDNVNVVLGVRLSDWEPDSSIVGTLLGIVHVFFGILSDCELSSDVSNEAEPPPAPEKHFSVLQRQEVPADALRHTPDPFFGIHETRVELAGVVSALGRGSLAADRNCAFCSLSVRISRHWASAPAYCRA